MRKFIEPDLQLLGLCPPCKWRRASVSWRQSKLLYPLRQFPLVIKYAVWQHYKQLHYCIHCRSVEQFNTMGCMLTGLVVLILYDQLTTFHHELDLFWSRRFSGPSLLFLTNRYIGVIYYVAMVPIRFVPSVIQVGHLVGSIYRTECSFSEVGSCMCFRITLTSHQAAYSYIILTLSSET